MRKTMLALGAFFAACVVASAGCGGSSDTGGAAAGTGGTGTSTSTSTTTTSGSGGGATTGSGGATTGSGGAAATCASYCSEVTTKCSDAAHTEYPMNSTDTCAKVCMDWAPTGMTADSLECHAYHAGLSAGNDDHCFHAGAWGASADGATPQCGTPCGNFCELEMQQCPNQYTDMAACTTACMGFTVGTFSIGATGNTLACRFYHLLNAFSDPATHCAHTAQNSAVCQ